MEYDVAQAYLNGHTVNEYAHSLPEHNQNLWQCGAETITACKNCNHVLRGVFHVLGATEESRM
jgi:hypothetical protein